MDARRDTGGDTLRTESGHNFAADYEPECLDDFRMRRDTLEIAAATDQMCGWSRRKRNSAGH
jgi:hypothetical protein